MGEGAIPFGQRKRAGCQSNRPFPQRESDHHVQNLYVLDKVAHPVGGLPFGLLKDNVPVPQIIQHHSLIIGELPAAGMRRNPY